MPSMLTLSMESRITLSFKLATLLLPAEETVAEVVEPQPEGTAVAFPFLTLVVTSPSVNTQGAEVAEAEVLASEDP